MIIYKIGGQHRAPKGLTYSCKGVGEDEEIPKGWYPSLNDAVEAHGKPTQGEKMAATKAANKAKKAEKD